MYITPKQASNSPVTQKRFAVLSMARKDLEASISHFKQGVILLNKAVSTKTCGKGSLNVVPAAMGRDEDMKEDKRG